MQLIKRMSKLCFCSDCNLKHAYFLLQPVKRAPPPAMEMDEDAELQLALSLSKKEHQQVVITV